MRKIEMAGQGQQQIRSAFYMHTESVGGGLFETKQVCNTESYSGQVWNEQ